MSVPALRDAVEGWLHPVPGGAPTGVDARYLPRAEALRAEVGKLDAPTGGAVDWARVLKDAERLTRETTKDVLVLAYAAVALAELRGLAGLAEGCLLVAEGCDRFWDGMYPPASRPRARIRALEWLAARATASVENAAVTAPDRPTVAALAAAVARLREVSRARLGDRAPSLRAVEEGVARLRLALPSPPDRSPPPAALAAGPAQPRAAPAGAGAGSKGGP
ncbi:MAG: type VI secretion system ImpA family N-terminal domain-containing protein, partial [Sandaracinaceae bacterium]